MSSRSVAYANRSERLETLLNQDQTRMHRSDHKVNLRRFIQVGEMLDHAFPDPMPIPDYLAHECERAEQALVVARVRTGSTADPLLANLFSIKLVGQR